MGILDECEHMMIGQLDIVAVLPEYPFGEIFHFGSSIAGER